ncbi:MAG: BamA/TamA family outer membrane protein [Bacteroidaceae bacterium]|nr:BamA/TamA family outer membrane protein [Bacteroidaceae bacterium]
MKKNCLLLAALSLSLSVMAQKEEIIKTGWNFGPLPVVGFDSDLGFQYGLCCDIFNYGNGTNYPQYDYKINVEASTYTKGSSILRTYGDFKTLIPDGKLFFDITYFNAPKFGFYGYNGYATKFDPDLIFPAGLPEDTKTGYNFMSRNQFRALASIRKTITGNLSWAAGLAFYHIKTDRLNLKEYEGQMTLYDAYIAQGLIRDDEKNGGNVTQLRAGLVYDSRNHDSDPTRGENIELSLVYAPDLIDAGGYSNLGVHLSLCQYLPIFSDRLTFAYRALVQAKLWGEIPYYFTNNINSMFFRKMYTEGLGGNASVRGLNRNGVLGDGFLMLNTELRWRIYDFKFINQNWQIATNPFFDLGKIIQPYRLDEQKAAIGMYQGDESKPHFTAGLGIKLIMNHNMVISFEGGKPFNSNDGTGLWTNIGFNYLF